VISPFTTSRGDGMIFPSLAGVRPGLTFCDFRFRSKPAQARKGRTLSGLFIAHVLWFDGIDSGWTAAVRPWFPWKAKRNARRPRLITEVTGNRVRLPAVPPNQRTQSERVAPSHTARLRAKEWRGHGQPSPLIGRASSPFDQSAGCNVRLRNSLVSVLATIARGRSKRNDSTERLCRQAQIISLHGRGMVCSLISLKVMNRQGCE